jgi:hypothetical protein
MSITIESFDDMNSSSTHGDDGWVFMKPLVGCKTLENVGICLAVALCISVACNSAYLVAALKVRRKYFTPVNLLIFIWIIINFIGTLTGMLMVMLSAFNCG